MRHSKVEIYLHVVWKTKNREPLICGELVRPVYRCIQAQVLKVRGTVLAVGGMPDHVHLLARVGGTVSAAKLASMVKGGSSRMLNDTLSDALPHYFDWQEGYGAFSVSRSHVKRVEGYIHDQERHHANNTVWPEWEETDESE